MGDVHEEIWKRAWLYVATMRSVIAIGHEGAPASPPGASARQRIDDEMRHLPRRLRARVLKRLRLTPSEPGSGTQRARE
jgi:hypothetical protein